MFEKRLQHPQIQLGSADSRTECTRTTEALALYRPEPGTVLLPVASQTGWRV
jgi:hypothetical protein